MTDEDPRRDEALATVADARRSLPNTLPYGTMAWVVTVFGTLLVLVLVLVSVICAIPPAAKAIFNTDGNPIALVGAVFYGFIAAAGIRYVRGLQRARKYLREHPHPGDPAFRKPTWWYVLARLAMIIGSFYSLITFIFLMLAISQGMMSDGSGAGVLFYLFGSAGLVAALGYWGVFRFNHPHLPKDPAGQPTTRAR